MLKEFYRIMRAEGYRPASWTGAIVGLLIFAIVHLTYGSFSYFDMPSGWTIYPPLSFTMQAQSIAQAFYMAAVSFTNLAFIGISLIVLVVLLMREIVLWPNHGHPFANIGVTLMGLLYVSLPMALLNIIAFTDKGYTPRRIFFLIFLIWAADTGAYFAGKNFGKHKLAPSISPGKTWEGWAGGAALTLATGWAAGYFLPDIPLSHRLVAAGVVAVFGPLGDLAESMLKRSAGVKDSGTFLPGHGGLLDRFDAFLLVLPVLALLQVLVG